MSSHSMLGAYGSWAATLAGEGPNFLSFRHTHWIDPASWRPAARQRFRERVAMPDTEGAGECRIESQYEYDGLQVEELSWQLPYGPRTEAVLLKPAGARGPLPGVLALHDHGGHKFHGWQKITRTDSQQNAVNVDHQARAYGGAPWANRLAQRGYAVLVPSLSEAAASASRIYLRRFATAWTKKSRMTPNTLPRTTAGRDSGRICAALHHCRRRRRWFGGNGDQLQPDDIDRCVRA